MKIVKLWKLFLGLTALMVTIFIISVAAWVSTRDRLYQDLKLCQGTDSSIWVFGKSDSQLIIGTAPGSALCGATTFCLASRGESCESLDKYPIGGPYQAKLMVNDKGNLQGILDCPPKEYFNEREQNKEKIL